MLAVRLTKAVLFDGHL
ncbi:hypothetical protein VCCP103710_3208, partial [Vibrio cholerae CP1037(10)]